MEVLMGARELRLQSSGRLKDRTSTPAHGICRRKKNKGILSSCVDASGRPRRTPSDRSILQARRRALETACELPQVPLLVAASALRRSSDHALQLLIVPVPAADRPASAKRNLLLIDECHTTESKSDELRFARTERMVSFDHQRPGLNREITSKAQFADWLRETEPAPEDRPTH